MLITIFSPVIGSALLLSAIYERVTSPSCDHSPHSGQFSGENIRLGSRGDSYYEYLIKVWIQLRSSGSELNYLHEMYEQAMRGVRHLLVRKSIPKGLVFVGELPSGPKGSFSPKMDHLVCVIFGSCLNVDNKYLSSTP